MGGDYHHPTSLDELAGYGARRLLNQDWFYMGLYGAPGLFKSSTGLLFCKKAQETSLPDVPFDPRRQVVRSAEQYHAARRRLPPGSWIMRDEGLTSGGNRMRFMSKLNNDVVEDVNTGRKKFHGVVECTPFADDIDPRLQKHMHWTGRFHGKGLAKMHEVRVLGFKKTTVWEEHRFNLDILHCAVLDPSLWQGYLDGLVVDPDGREMNPLEREERLNRYTQGAAAILAGGLGVEDLEEE